MIFNVPGHIAMIQNGLFYDRLQLLYPDMIVKTQTRRIKRGIYQVGKDYAVQRKRGVKAEPGMRIVIDRIWEETTAEFHRKDSTVYPILIYKEDAWAEGGYTPEQYEKVFRELNPKRNQFSRWAFKFHVIEV